MQQYSRVVVPHAHACPVFTTIDIGAISLSIPKSCPFEGHESHNKEQEASIVAHSVLVVVEEVGEPRGLHVGPPCIYIHFRTM